jgi:hypothetical protein
MTMHLLRILLPALCGIPLCVGAVPLTPSEIAETCANADGGAHCARLIETLQLKRLPGLARRDGSNLVVTLYPQGTATFTDVDDPVDGRSYSLWDSLDAINAVLLYTTTNDSTSFTLLQRRSNRRFSLPAAPVVSPDRQRLVTADVCRKNCSNEIAVWKFSGDGLAKELSWTPPPAWTDAGATWKNAETLTIEYTAGAQADTKIERKLADPAWARVAPGSDTAPNR